MPKTEKKTFNDVEQSVTNLICRVCDDQDAAEDPETIEAIAQLINSLTSFVAVRS
jgi:hypothetical protein